MPIGSKALRQIQLGAEVTPGTSPGAATVLWRGMGTLKDELVLEELEEDVGILQGTDQTYKSKEAGLLVMEPVAATFQQVPYVFEAGLKKVGTGVADGPGTNYIYSYPISLATQNTLQSYEVKAGDDNAAEAMLYSLVRQFSLEGGFDQAVMVGAEWFGRDVAIDSFDALSLVTVEPIVAAQGQLFIDAIGGTIGTTAVTGTLLSWKLDVTTGATPVFTADNSQLYHQTHKIVRPEVRLEITFEHDGSASTEKANWRSQTKRLMQILVEGSAFGTPGTVYSNHSLVINMAGYWETFSELGDQDGNDTITGTFRVKYNPTAAQGLEIIVSNEVASLP